MAITFDLMPIKILKQDRLDPFPDPLLNIAFTFNIFMVSACIFSYSLSKLCHISDQTLQQIS